MADFIDRIAPAFKSHPAATVRKTGIPGYIIINALMTINKHKTMGVSE
jgi:hypothetical protein